MNSLFLRIYLSALAFFVVSFFLILYATNSLIFSKYLPDETTQIYQTIQTSLSNKPIQQWQQEIKTYNGIVDNYDISLIPQKTLSAQQKETILKQGQYLSDTSITETNLFMLYPLADSDYVLKIDENNITGNQSVDLANDIIFFTLFLLPLAFSLYWLVKKLTNPIEHLTQVAQKLGKGDLSIRADNNLLPPMNMLSEGFNNMAEQLGETIQEQQILIGAIPHELRTPLGRIRFALDMTRNDTTVSALRGNIENIDGYVDEMQQTVDEILELNRLQNQDQVDSEKFKICPLIESLLECSKKESPELTYHIDCDKSLSVSGNASLIERALSNVLNNAQRYAKTTINIKLIQNDKETMVVIEDDGDGIADDKRLDIFSPFSTLDDSRGRNNSGIGLGLAIVKLIMQKHTGDIIASHSDLGGACFKLHWRK